MERKIYTERRTLLRYDDNHYLAYLNEEVLEDYVPEVSIEETGETPAPTTAYAYTGEFPDGGTLLEVASFDRDSLINGVIRTKYSQSEEDAIKTHQIIRMMGGISEEKSTEYLTEWQEFCEWREYAIKVVDEWIG